MNSLKKLKSLLKEDREKIIRSIKEAKSIRDDSPSAMESHSDTTKSQYEKLIGALEEKLKEIDKILSIIPDKTNDDPKLTCWKVADVNLGINKLTIMLVPGGFGGKKIGSLITLSLDSPLGSIIKDKKTGEELVFNDQKIKIMNIKN